MAQKQAKQIRITVNMENAAFEEPSELPRILRELAGKLEPERRYMHFGLISLRDINGNKVGEAVFSS
jgi:hypothetical protein